MIIIFFKKDRIPLKRIKKLIVSISLLLILWVLGHYLLGYTGLAYLKSDEGKEAYEFTEDMNGDEKKEIVKFVNHYRSYYKMNTCDSEYTSNHIRIYLDGKQIYSDKITTLGPLIEPEIVDLIENNTKKRQIYVHANGGGPAIPMDYFFHIRGNKVVVNSIESDL